MHKKSSLKQTFGTVLVLAATVIPSRGQSLTTLVNFTATNGAYLNGIAPESSLIKGPGGNLFGTTSTTVFQLTTTGTLTTLHTFDGTDGSGPYGALVLGTDGNFYGTTTGGGTTNDGTVFKMSPDGALTTLHSFNESDGTIPAGALIQASDGNFYGTTSGNALAKVDPTVFRITSAGTLTTLYTFNNPGDGRFPYGALVQYTDGSFYGTTAAGGGSDNCGTVFRITATGSITYPHIFDWTDGAAPAAGLVLASDGNFYGTTSSGGTNGFGTVFRMTPAGTLTTLHSFDGSDGLAPIAALIQGNDGNFYGTTDTGTGPTNPGGTVFQITAAGALKTLANFNVSNGANALAALFQNTDGNFYGTTSGGGSGSAGTVFALSLSSVSSVAPSPVTITSISPSTVVPGEWIVIYGEDLATTTVTATAGYPTSLGGTSVTIGGQAAPLLYVSPGLIILEVPTYNASGAVPVVVTTAKGSAMSSVSSPSVSR